ncbi:MAG: DUF3800 domain-containing protein [Acidobacteriaceae bacterium]
MLKYFVDDSGSDASADGLFVLYGYQMEEARWEDFAQRWDAQLKRPDFFPIDYCRMSDAEAGTGPFVGMDDIFRKRKVRDLAGVIRDCNPTGVGCKMTWKAYNEIVRGKVDSRLDNPYAILFFHVLRSVTDLQIEITSKVREEDKKRAKEELRIEITIKPVEFIFDDQGPAGLQCLKWWGELKSKLQEPHLTVLSNTPQFKDDRELVPLQAADMLAWHIRRDFEYPSEDRRDVFDLINPFGVWEREITEYQLKQVVEGFNNRVDLNQI